MQPAGVSKSLTRSVHEAQYTSPTANSASTRLFAEHNWAILTLIANKRHRV